MSDPEDVVHAAISSMEHDDKEALKPKKKDPPKPVNVVWSNLAYME